MTRQMQESMILYATVGVSDFARAKTFYDAVLATLDHQCTDETAPGWAGYGPAYADGVSFWICTPFNGAAARPGNGAMVAFRAQSAAQVQAFHAAALQHGGTDEGAPGTRSYYDPSFYVAYARDPDGNKLACVFHRYDGSV